MISSQYFTKKNRPIKIWAIVITLVVWITVVSGHTETRSFDIRTSFSVGADKIITSELPSYIHVEVEGNLFNLLSIPSRAFTVSKNLSHLQKDKLTLYFDSQDFPHLKDVHITSIYPKKIAVSISQKVSKSVAVDPFLVGRPLFGYRIAKVALHPSRLTISGPVDTLEDLEAISTSRINIAGKRELVTASVGIMMKNPHIALEGEESVKVTVEFERDIQHKEFRFVPLQIEGDAVATIQPKTVGVYLRGPIDILEKLEEEGFFATVPYRAQQKYRVQDYTLAGLPDEITVVRKQKIKKISVFIRKKPPAIRKQQKK